MEESGLSAETGFYRLSTEESQALFPPGARLEHGTSRDDFWETRPIKQGLFLYLVPPTREDLTTETQDYCDQRHRNSTMQMLGDEWAKNNPFSDSMCRTLQFRVMDGVTLQPRVVRITDITKLERHVDIIRDGRLRERRRHSPLDNFAMVNPTAHCQIWNTLLGSCANEGCICNEHEWKADVVVNSVNIHGTLLEMVFVRPGFLQRWLQWEAVRFKNVTLARSHILGYLIRYRQIQKNATFNTKTSWDQVKNETMSAKVSKLLAPSWDFTQALTGVKDVCIQVVNGLKHPIIQRCIVDSIVESMQSYRYGRDEWSTTRPLFENGWFIMWKQVHDRLQPDTLSIGRRSRLQRRRSRRRTLSRQRSRRTQSRRGRVAS